MATAEDPATFSNIQIKHMGNKGIVAWEKVMSLSRTQAKFYGNMLNKFMVQCNELPSAEMEVHRRQIITCLQTWGAPVEKLNSKIDTVNLMKMLAFCKALATKFES